ncbi:MAG: hypothetical protein QOF37_3072 [Thermoleophilaceae bacterium]|nr:hypothetical protein [Thermoleophilaceae bacterium]
MSDARRLVLVVGVGRSGTSLLAGILGQVGFHIPQPEVQADDTNPRGFGEPRWAVDFHSKLMSKARVTVFDSRPAAWDATTRAGNDPATQDELRAWLGEQLAQADAVVVKDPRIGWFLPLWQRSATELGVPTSFVTMLRHPAEILASAKRSYGGWQTDASRAASWTNEMLEIERGTRGSKRVFVRYQDLLADWGREAKRAGQEADLPLLRDLDRASFPQVDQFVDPALHRNRGGWDGLEVPTRVSELADEVWAELNRLAEPGADAAAVATELDRLSRAYTAMHAEAEAIAQSAVTAVRPRKKKPAAAAPARPVSLRGRLARRLPPRYRKRLRRALGSLSRS